MFALDLGGCLLEPQIGGFAQSDPILLSPVREIIKMFVAFVFGQEHANYTSQQTKSQTHGN